MCVDATGVGVHAGVVDSDNFPNVIGLGVENLELGPVDGGLEWALGVGKMGTKVAFDARAAFVPGTTCYRSV